MLCVVSSMPKKCLLLDLRFGLYTEKNSVVETVFTQKSPVNLTIDSKETASIRLR